MPVETHSKTTTKTTYGTPVVEAHHTTQYTNQPVDDRSLGEKAMDALSSAAQTVKDALTPEVKDTDIAKAAREHEELRQKEEMDRRRAEGASAQQSQLEAEAQRLQVNSHLHTFKMKNIIHFYIIIHQRILPTFSYLQLVINNFTDTFIHFRTSSSSTKRTS